MSLVIIGVDPGDSAGVAIIKDTALWHAFQGSPGDALTLIELTITRFDDADSEDQVAVACERYVNLSRRARTHQPTAQKMAGALEHLATHHKCKFRFQGPADAWAVASDERLKQLGMRQTPDTINQPDAKDVNMAVRHALLYMSNTHATVFHELLRANGIML